MKTAVLHLKIDLVLHPTLFIDDFIWGKRNYILYLLTTLFFLSDIHTYIHTHTHIYIYIYIYIERERERCVCVCV